MSADRMKPVHCLSFDVEEYFQVSAFWTEARRQQWDRLESRVETSTRKIADHLAAHGTRATFFILGWVAERHPGLVKALAMAGHEIASHGYGHELVTAQSPAEFREDVRKAKRILEDLVGQPVFGYRAPSFSITRKTLWALSILVQEGYLYDTSVFPIVHDRYGIPGAKPTSHQLDTDAGPIWEIPPSTFKLFRARLPIAGGGYFRLFPYPLLRRLLRRVEREGHPLVMYLHPWELDPDQPKMQGPLLSRARHYLNLRRTEPRFVSLLKDFQFAPLKEALAPIAQRVGKNVADWVPSATLA
jgi:polysaccharide deacetylase family protein (PEP-CTERM system associated)